MPLSSVGFGFGFAGPCNRKKDRGEARSKQRCTATIIALLFPLCHCLFLGKCAVTISEHDDDASETSTHFQTCPCCLVEFFLLGMHEGEGN